MEELIEIEINISKIIRNYTNNIENYYNNTIMFKLKSLITLKDSVINTILHILIPTYEYKKKVVFIIIQTL